MSLASVSLTLLYNQVCCMAATCGLTDGFHSNNFAIATVLALIVMYDATGVRFNAGKQAEVRTSSP